MKTFAISALLLVTLAPAVQADAAENYIKYRQAMMKAIGGHMGAVTQIVRGKVSPEGDLAMHAEALVALNRDLARLFPEGSDFGETKAKEAIWADWDRFEQKAADAATATQALAEAVASGDSDRIRATHKGVGDACKGCHEDFRQKDD